MICRVCDSAELTSAVDLGTQPWANHFLAPKDAGREPSYPLRVVLCAKCGTSQLDYTVPKETMFADHTYLSGMTKTLSDHFRGVAEQVDRRFFASRPGKACSTSARTTAPSSATIRSSGYDILGVEPAKLPSDLANAAGLTTLRAFFNAEVARSLGRKFEVINASGVFFHLEELHSVTDGIRESLAEGGVFVIQFLYMKRIVENDAFDQIYHEHLLYYNVRTLDRLLRRHGLALFDAELSPIHGGSIIAYATHAAKAKPSPALEAFGRAEDEAGANALPWYQAFTRRIARHKEENLAYLRAAKAKGKTVFGLGAPVKGNTLLNYYGIGPDLISCLTERNPPSPGAGRPGQPYPGEDRGRTRRPSGHLLCPGLELQKGDPGPAMRTWWRRASSSTSGEPQGGLRCASSSPAAADSWGGT